MVDELLNMVKYHVGYSTQFTTERFFKKDVPFMHKQIGRTDLDSVIDTLAWDIDTRRLLRSAIQCFGVEVLDPFIGVYRGTLTTNTQNRRVRNTQYIAASPITEDLQQLLSDSFLPTPLGGRWGAPPDVPAAFGASAQKFARKFRAPRTLQRRYSSWKKILRLCLQADVCPLPMSVGTAIGIVSHIADSGVSYGEVSACRDAIVFVHKYAQQPNPVDHPRFKRVWAGIVRSLGTANLNRKWALTRDEVGQMIAAALKAGRYDHAVQLAVCYEGAFRVSEICNQRIEDVYMNGSRARVYVSTSKTDQTGDGDWVELELRARAPFDASAMLTAWIERLGRSEGYLFVNVRKGRLTHEPIDARTFTRTVKRYATLIGLPPSQIGSHSLRAGYITEELSLNRPQAEVAAHARHASTEMLMRYFRPRTAPRNFVRKASNGKSV